MTYILQESISGSPADDAGLLDLGSIMGQCHTFGAVAGRCSGAHPATLRGLRERCYLRVSANWRAFCNEYLKMSQTQADPIIQLWDEFGAAYFELAQLTRISPALSPTIYSGAVQCNGQAIELSVENSRRVAALVAELRHSLPATKPPHPISMSQRFSQLDKRCAGIVADFEEISRQEQHGDYWLRFTEIPDALVGCAAPHRVGKRARLIPVQNRYFSPA